MSDLSEFLSAARSKVEAATPGPWTACADEDDCPVVCVPPDHAGPVAWDPNPYAAERRACLFLTEADASLIAFSRNVLPALLDVVEAAERYERANAAAWRSTGAAGANEGDGDLAYGFDEAESALRAAIARLCQNKEK